MDIDCDGVDNSVGKCGDDPSGQSQTSFKSTAQSYNLPDLNSSIHGYVVFGNEGENPSFDPRKAGMEPLSVMAVICNNNLASSESLAWIYLLVGYLLILGGLVLRSLGRHE